MTSNQKQQEDIKFYNFLGQRITINALIIVILGIILSLIIAIIMPNPIGLGVALALLLGSLLVSYNLNCLRVGHCTVWAWILTILYILAIFMHIIWIFVNKDEWLANVLRTPSSSMPKK